MTRYGWQSYTVGANRASGKNRGIHCDQLPAYFNQGEVLYVAKGNSFGESSATDNQGNLIGTFETLRVVDYVEIPVLARLEFPSQGRVHPTIYAGPALAFEIAERLETTGDVKTSFGTDDFASTDFGITAGAELRLPTGPGWSLLDVRYTFGLIDVEDRDPDREEKNRALLVMLGYAF